MLSHDAPVLDVCWSSVGLHRSRDFGANIQLIMSHRMERKCSVPAPTTPRVCLILLLTRCYKLQPTTHPSSLSDG